MSAVAGALGALAACMAAPSPPGTMPQARPAGFAPATPPRIADPSNESLALSRYYARAQSNMLARGLLRSDGGGADTPYTDTDLLRNFERIVFTNEHSDASFARSNTPSPLRKWTQPVRFGLTFGPSVSPDMRARDTATISNYAARLARIADHPIALGGTPNFHIMIVSEDERQLVVEKLREINPNISETLLRQILALPRQISCTVLAFPERQGTFAYRSAVAVIRAEQPDMSRTACIHEELSQGLGLANDSPRARPSIFNDDEEFGRLTTHDEELLRMLYDPRLRAGMSLEEARPILRDILAERSLGPS
ncbi:DUF2927 domain-containing protein [Roseovarius sp. LXJ103]|uniref:DUF2927 domain-containing protein n=1 Tax=Roseovarius carneus TaxID=2853164 RepID=UPI000D60E4A4|nr:DUF2927 domain-containing protein [Roseovarius carneus]MBZ8119697.1 DUF2927 domain-containing protein [Roseovarius carneus]PWE37149.1 hypothetical protein DD563_01045 [Pelagicola sp. LXJ1103]